MAQQECGQRVGRGTITWPCTLTVNHLGPCYAVESTASAGDRRRWEREHDEKERQIQSGLSQFQGPAQTTAQRYTENPTPVPLSPGRRRQHMDCTMQECLLGPSFADECPTYDAMARPSDEAPAFDPHDRSQRGKPWERETYVKDGDTHAGRETASPGTVKGQVLEGFEGPPHAAPFVSGPPAGAPQFPTKQREGDQRLPDGDRRRADVQSLVIADVTARREVGIERYGQALQTFNGRDTLLDAYEEALDLTVYLRSLLEMKRADRERLVKVVYDALVANSIETYGVDLPELDKQTAAEVAVDRILDHFA